MASNTSSLMTSMYILLSTSLALSAAPTPPFKKIYSFGDSYTDTGNTKTSTGPAAFNHVSNPPYGITFFHHPTNRYSDGRIVIDFIAEALSLPLIPPYRDLKADRSHGVNFAVAGGTAIRRGFFLKNNITFNLVRQSALQTQLVWYEKIMESEGCKDMKNTPKECDRFGLRDALVWVGELGSNDYTSILGSSISTNTIRRLSIKSVIRFLQVMLNKGHKYIVIQGLSATGCTTFSFTLASPQDRDKNGCVSTMNKLAHHHNAALKTELKNLRKKYPQSVLVYADFYKSHLKMIKNPRKYGFKERFKACCGYGGGENNFDVFNTCGAPSSSSFDNPWEYINWDGAHYTEAAYKVVADLCLNGTSCNPPFDYLLRKKLNWSNLVE